MKNEKFTVIHQNMTQQEMSVRDADHENDLFREAFEAAIKDENLSAEQQFFALDFFIGGWEAAVSLLNDDTERATAGNAAPTLHCAFCHSTTRHADGRCTECGKSKFMTWAEITGQVASNTATAAPGDLTDERIQQIIGAIPYGDGWDGERWNLAIARAIEREVLASNAGAAAPGDLPPLPEKIGTLYPGNYWTGKDDTNIFSMAIAEVVTMGQCKEYGRACIASNAGAAIPEGFVIVPVNPTPKMVDATFNHVQERNGEPESHNTRNKRIYRAMLAAAPSNPPVGAKEQNK